MSWMSNSGAVHVVDDVTYDVIAMFEDTCSLKEIVEQLVRRSMPKADIEEAIRRGKSVKGQTDSSLLEDVYNERIY